MSNIPMQGLADELRRESKNPSRSAFEYTIFQRWASEVEAAQAALSAGQEPVAWMPECGSATTDADVAASWRKHGGKVAPLFAHPAPKGEAEEVLRDAERYRWLRSFEHCNEAWCFIGGGDAENDLDMSIDRARALVAYGVPPTPELGWCEHCGEGVTDFCRGKSVLCPRGLRVIKKSDAGVKTVDGGRDADHD